MNRFLEGDKEIPNPGSKEAFDKGFDMGGQTKGGTGRIMYEQGKQEILQSLLDEVEEKKTWYSGEGNKPIREALSDIQAIIKNRMKNI